MSPFYPKPSFEWGAYMFPEADRAETFFLHIPPSQFYSEINGDKFLDPPRL
jgi:hypothetical protein